MNKFEEYNSSQIVPQRTLLQKFNKLIEFLKVNPTYNLFISNEDYIGTSNVYMIGSIDIKKYKLEVGDLVLFNNVYIGVVSMVGTISYSISRAIYFKGATGEKGESGNSFRIIGTVNSTAELPATAPYGTAYFVGTQPPRQVYVFDSLTNSWINEGFLQAELTIQELASNLIGDNDISITYHQDTQKISFEFNSANYFTRNQIIELLQGKTISYVINSKSEITGTDSGDEITNVSAITGITLTDLKIGDIILLKNVNEPDYWVSQISPTISLSKMEISKVDLLNGVYPIGSIYMSVVSINPSVLFGGTWEILNNGNQLHLVKSSKMQVYTDEDNALSTPRHSLYFRNNYNNTKPTTNRTLGLSANGGDLIDGGNGNPSNTAYYPSNLYADVDIDIGVYVWKRTA